MTKDIYIVDGLRTPMLKARGAPGFASASDLAVMAARPLLLRQKFPHEAIDEVILGCAMPSPDEANIARLVTLRLGLPQTTTAWTVHRNCASGMQSIDSAANQIALGHADIVLAGGAEAMSHAPLLFSEHFVRWLSAWQGARKPQDKLKVLMRLRPAYFKPVIGLLRGLTDASIRMSMGQTAENIAHLLGVTRRESDQFAVRSHERLAQAQDDEALLDEIEPIYDTKGHAFAHDTGLRRESAVEKLAKLSPVFEKKFGQVTAGNSAQITDGAAWVVVASQEAVERYQLPVLGKIVATRWAGLDPAQMGLGPVYATAKLLSACNLSLSDIDYWEINEAFAAQVVACLKAFADKDFCSAQLGLDQAMGDIDAACLNIDGGAVACGHPVGMTGTRIVLHLLHVLHRKQAKRGIATLCIGGGQGGAMLLERVT